jgi:plasmid recombination enzyme
LNNLSKREKHNLRKFKKNVKQEGEFIDLIDRKGLGYTDYFKQELGSRIENALVDYNRNQRAGRKIKDVDEYIKKIEGSKNKKNLAVEMIVGVGDRQMWQEEPFKSERKSIENVFKDYVKYLQENMPEFVLISATIHQDEDTPHCHIIGIPLYEGDKKGLSVKIAKGKVFTRDTLKAMQDDVRLLFEEGINENYKLDEPFKFGEKQTGRNWDYTVAEYKKQKENFKITNEIKELQELKGTLDNDVKLFYDSLEFVKNPFDYNHTNKIEKLENVKKTYMEINQKMDNIFLKTKEKAQFLEGKVDKIKLDDKTIEELEKNLTRKYKKELGDKIRDKFVDSDELKDFEKRVYEDYKKQIENKVVRQTTIKKELEKLELMREELQKEFNEQFENHKRNVENWEKQKELEQEKIEKEHNDKFKKIEEEKLSLENLKEYCRTHDLYELKKQQSFLDNSITLKMKTLDNMDKEIKSLEIKSCNIKNKLAQYTQEDNQKIADLKEYKEKKEEVKNILNTVDEKNKELENINKNIAEKSKELEDINKNITDKNKQITELDNTIKTKENEIEKAEKTLFDYGMQETKLIDKINDYKDKNEYIDIIKNRFISNAAKLIANKTDFSFGKSSSLVEKNINTVFVNTITSEWDKQNYDNIDVNKILKSLNYKDKKETKDTVKNDYTSYYDDYNK